MWVPCSWAKASSFRTVDYLTYYYSFEVLLPSSEASNHRCACLADFHITIVTILAFVYVPLNLASSIYGMNIQQLNGSGQSVWVFVVTAVVALLITAGTWYLSEATNTYRR